MATQIPAAAVCVVNSSNLVIGASGVAGTAVRIPQANVHFVDSTGKIIESNNIAGSVTDTQPNMAVAIVDQSNLVIASNGTLTAVTRQPSLIVRAVGSGTVAQMVLRVVDDTNTILDQIFGGVLSSGNLLLRDATSKILLRNASDKLLRGH